MRLYLTLILLLLLCITSLAYASTVVDLQCADMQTPLGINQASPKLSWKLVSHQRNVNQKAYQILVSSSLDLLARGQGDIWNSGKIVSSRNLYVSYTGSPLKSRREYFWKVRIWDSVSGKSEWSTPASWTMGLLSQSDWHADWISASRWFMPQQYRPAGLKLGGDGGWADVDLGTPHPIQQINLYPNSDDSFPTRFKIECADNFQFENKRVLVDRSSQDFLSEGTAVISFPVADVSARFIRLEIIGTGKPTTVRQMQVISNGVNVALMRPTKEYNTDWSTGHAPFLVDGMPSANDGPICPPGACPTTSAPLLRREFSVIKPIVRAVLYHAALGMAVVSINGEIVGDEVNGPPFSDYTKRVYYLTHDVTSLIHHGNNVIGTMLGNGFFSTPSRGFGERQGGNGAPRFLAQLEITFADGTTKTIVTDRSWSWNLSEITFNDYWQGYAEDRRLAKPGWNEQGYTAGRTWLRVAELPSLGGKLCSPLSPPVRIRAEIKPDRIEGNHAYFHTLTAGWPKILVDGHAGQVITVGGLNESFSYTLAADGPAVLEPRFVLTTGPLDLTVNGLNGPLTPGSVTMQCVGADLQQTGSFSCSNAFLNKVYMAAWQTHFNYDQDFPADPTREKQGWTQDAQGFFDSAAYLTDARGIYHRWWSDMADNQDPDGYVGSVLPVVGRQVYDWNSPWWSGVTVFIPWEHYLYYGDVSFLKEAYIPMKKYVDFLGLVADSGIGTRWDDYAYFGLHQDPAAAKSRMIVWNGAGDWLNPTTGGQFVVPAPITTMPAYYYYATIISRTAGLLGKSDDEQKYKLIAVDIKRRFNKAYFNSDTGLYGTQTDNETAQVLPIGVGLVPDNKVHLAYERLIDAIHARHDHVACGFVALPWLLQILADHRETALANRMVNQQDFPSWNTLMHDGILGEGWSGGGAQMPSTGGSIVMWLYQSVLGIRPDAAGPGFKKFIIAPQPDSATGLTSASGWYDSVYGPISSSWTVIGKTFTLRAGIPANTSATVAIPTSDLNSVTESGKPASHADGVRFIGTDGTCVSYRVGSGDYHFSADYQENR